MHQNNCFLPIDLYPSWEHTTLASLLSKPNWHMPLHTLLLHISTLPSSAVGPPTNLTSLSLQLVTTGFSAQDKKI